VWLLVKFVDLNKLLDNIRLIYSGMNLKLTDSQVQKSFTYN